MVLKHFTIYNPPNLHLWKSLAIISVQITTHSICYSLSHAQAAPLAISSELTEMYSHARRVTKKWYVTYGISLSVSKRRQSSEMNMISLVYHQLRTLSPVKQMQNIAFLSFAFKQRTLRAAGRLGWSETRYLGISLWNTAQIQTRLS